MLLTDLFPTRIRFTGVALVFNVAFTLFSGTAPLVATTLVRDTGMSTAPAWVMIGCGVLTLLASVGLGRLGGQRSRRPGLGTRGPGLSGRTPEDRCRGRRRSQLRRYAVARSLFPPTTLAAAIDALGFVQADPIRAPARAQDLILRHRVAGYRAGDLERQYRTLEVEEDFFVNYGFLARRVQALMHPRGGFGAWPSPGARTGARCWPTCASTGRCIRATSTRTSPTAPCATTGAARRTPRPTPSTICTTAACCASTGATAASGCMRPTTTGRR